MAAFSFCFRLAGSEGLKSRAGLLQMFYSRVFLRVFPWFCKGSRVTVYGLQDGLQLRFRASTSGPKPKTLQQKSVSPNPEHGTASMMHTVSMIHLRGQDTITIFRGHLSRDRLGIWVQCSFRKKGVVNGPFKGDGRHYVIKYHVLNLTSIQIQNSSPS